MKETKIILSAGLNGTAESAKVILQYCISYPVLRI